MEHLIFLKTLCRLKIFLTNNVLLIKYITNHLSILKLGYTIFFIYL